ncbi:MAG TPA: hypothetical protein VEK73_14415 [Xanthobacteraceae bacterium]|nr:hypothetical protein [Xanthobacteraceae bacterium]
MSSPTDRVYEPGDPSPYAPRWVRNAPQGPRRIPAGGPMEGQIDGLDDEADAALVQSEHAPPLAAAPPVAVGEPFVIDDIRVPRSLDPGIVPDPWPARHARLRRARLFGMFGRLALAGSVAAVVALLAMGKLSLPGGSGATEPADPSSAFGSRFAPPAAVPQEPPALAQSPSEPPAQVALAQPAAPAAAAPLAAIVPTPAPVAPEPASAAPALYPDSPQTAALLKRGQELAATGDIAAARLTLRPAAEARNAQAALALGATYDPVVLQTLGIFGVRPDVAMARSWYEKAKEYGSAEAPRRLELLATRAP